MRPLAYEIHGSGEPLVLVHGLTHRRQAWYPVLEHLTDHRRVILVDLPGHGESADLVLRGRPLQEAIRAELESTFAELALERPHIAGNSLGGRVSLEAAADGLVRSATTLSPAGFWRGRADFLYVRSLFAALTTSARLAQPVIPLVAPHALGRAALCGVTMARPARMKPEAVVGDARGMIRALPAMRQIFPAAEPFARQIPGDIPVTIAWGARDLVLLTYQAARARAQLPSADHLMLPGCGHVPMSDDPELVAGVLLRGSGLQVDGERVA